MSHTNTKPKGFPDNLELNVHGVPVVIDYTAQDLLISKAVPKEEQFSVREYLIAEGFINIEKEGQ